MALSLFIDKSLQPDETVVSEVLGAQWDQWQCIRQHVADAYAGSAEEWKFYGRSSGWTLLLKQKKRTILYLFPGQERFTVLFVFGEAAVASATQSDLPEPVKTAIRDARPYMEGRSFHVDVASVDDATVVQRLIAIKMNA